MSGEGTFDGCLLVRVTLALAYDSDDLGPNQVVEHPNYVNLLCDWSINAKNWEVYKTLLENGYISHSDVAAKLICTL